jgi:hypothetical protein
LYIDNASWYRRPPHKKLKEDYGYIQLSWPPNLLNLNSIEIFWNILKSRLRKRFSLLELRPYSGAEMFTTAKKEWTLITHEDIDNLIYSLSKCM